MARQTIATGLEPYVQLDADAGVYYFGFVMDGAYIDLAVRKIGGVDDQRGDAKQAQAQAAEQAQAQPAAGQAGGTGAAAAGGAAGTATAEQPSPPAPAA